MPSRPDETETLNVKTRPPKIRVNWPNANRSSLEKGVLHMAMLKAQEQTGRRIAVE
jgi:hypothetical protein